MQRKTTFQRLSALEEVDRRDEAPREINREGKTKNISAPLQKFQNLVSTITMTRALRQRALLRSKIAHEDSGEFRVSHATSPDDDDRRPATALTRASTTRTDVLSRLNTSEHFRFTTEPNRKFQDAKVSHVIAEVFRENLSDCSYTTELCQKMSPILADVIKDRVKRLVFPRYKIVVHVMMGQVTGQSMRSASRCAWNEHFDNFAQYCYQTPTLFATAVVYGVYVE